MRYFIFVLYVFILFINLVDKLTRVKYAHPYLLLTLDLDFRSIEKYGAKNILT